MRWLLALALVGCGGRGGGGTESSRARNEFGITTSTIGIGTKFQEDILAALAHESGGRFWYIGEARIEDIIKEDFGGALSVIFVRAPASWRSHGRGIIARADELRSLVAFHVVADEAIPELFKVRLAAFKHGKVVSLIGLKEAISIPGGRLELALQFFSGDMVGQVATSTDIYTLKCTFPMPPFPGWAGVVRFYNAPMIAQNIQIEKITMKPILEEGTDDDPADHYPFHVFLPHSSADKDAVLDVLSALTLLRQVGAGRRSPRRGAWHAEQRAASAGLRRRERTSSSAVAAAARPGAGVERSTIAAAPDLEHRRRGKVLLSGDASRRRSVVVDSGADRQGNLRRVRDV